MKLKHYLKEDQYTGMGADGLSKQRLKTLIYKEVKKCTHNRLYKDQHWQGINCIWDVFKKLDLNWQLNKSEYKHTNLFVCKICGRIVCKDCYKETSLVGMVKCPMCMNKLVNVEIKV